MAESRSVSQDVIDTLTGGAIVIAIVAMVGVIINILAQAGGGNSTTAYQSALSQFMSYATLAIIGIVMALVLKVVISSLRGK